MKPLELAYSKVPNMGDLLNEYIFERVFFTPFVHSERIWRYEVTGIGSFLDMLFTGPEVEKSKIKSMVTHALFYEKCKKTCYTWGTGFISDFADKRTGVIRNNVEFLALRGKLTQKCVEKIIGKPISPILGDGGILTPMLFEKGISKKYRVGLIPHFREKNSSLIEVIKKAIPDIHVIDLQEAPLSVIQDIASCEILYSSSLHGLVLADAFRIPNIRIHLSDAPLGGTFKFDDYYSAYGLIVPAVDIDNVDSVPSLNDVIDRYKITDSMVKKMQDELYSSMKQVLSKRE